MAHATNHGGESSSQAFRSTRVVTPAGVRPATVIADSGRIKSVAAWNEVPHGALLHDFGNHVLLPGLVDTHVHINEADPGPGAELTRNDWEGFATATQAAAAGGVTTLVDMPLNCVPETLTAAALQAKRSAAEGQTYVDWMTWGGAVGNNGLCGNESEFPALIAAGVPGFKCFLVHSGIDGFAWIDEPQLRKTLAALRGTGLPLLCHAEIVAPVDRATATLNRQQADWRLYANYLASRPGESELAAIELLIELAGEFDTPIHIVHLGTARALPMLRAARASGLKITVETCPQYLHFASENIPDGATEFKCAPPIRDAANREALWQALLDGDIDFVATDHSPCPPALKHRESGRFDQAWGGIASLGLALPILWSGLDWSGLDRRNVRSPRALELVSRWLSFEPARLAGLMGQKGAIQPGSDADFAVFDPDAKWTVTESDLRFRHKLSPYLGENLRGRVLQTWLRGQRIYSLSDSDKFNSPIGSNPIGRELRRTA